MPDTWILSVNLVDKEEIRSKKRTSESPIFQIYIITKIREEKFEKLKLSEFHPEIKVFLLKTNIAY